MPIFLSVAGAGAQARVGGQNEGFQNTIIREILLQWNKSDVVCLGEDHGSARDSALRIALIEHPDFIRTVNTVMVEFADSKQQELLDRFVIDGEDMPREKLRLAWSSTSGSEVWDLPVYEDFIRSVRKINLKLPRDRRIRLLGGDTSGEKNRGRSIREAVSREILDKNLKALSIYGSRHCERRGFGFPGELADKYPGKIWAVIAFDDPNEGKRIFGLGDFPQYVRITGTEKAGLSADKIFAPGRSKSPATLGDVTDAVVYFGKPVERAAPVLKANGYVC